MHRREFLKVGAAACVASYFDVGNTITWTKQPPEHWARVLEKRIVKLDVKDRGHAEFGDPRLRSKS